MEDGAAAHRHRCHPRHRRCRCHHRRRSVQHREQLAAFHCPHPHRAPFQAARSAVVMAAGGEHAPLRLYLAMLVLMLLM